MTPRSRRRQSGQLLPIVAVGFVVLAAIAGLAIDASRDYLAKRNAQNAADFAALAAAKAMTLSGNLSVSISPNTAPVYAAHDFAANNGFTTNFNTACDNTSAGFTTSWFDIAGVPCAARLAGAACVPGQRGVLVCAGRHHHQHRGAVRQRAWREPRVRDGRGERSRNPSWVDSECAPAERAGALSATERMRTRLAAVLQGNVAGRAGAALMHRRDQQLSHLLDPSRHPAVPLRLRRHHLLAAAERVHPAVQRRHGHPGPDHVVRPVRRRDLRAQHGGGRGRLRGRGRLEGVLLEIWRRGIVPHPLHHHRPGHPQRGRRQPGRVLLAHLLVADRGHDRSLRLRLAGAQRPGRLRSVRDSPGALPDPARLLQLNSHQPRHL
ncbi:MAG: hypothetical protein E6J12_08540 [Chloroflexi bacterium]|nr:MAG: hypothetical protein E6J12_08540 [Chloroflexota bacterium]